MVIAVCGAASTSRAERRVRRRPRFTQQIDAQWAQMWRRPARAASKHGHVAMLMLRRVYFYEIVSGLCAVNGRYRSVDSM